MRYIYEAIIQQDDNGYTVSFPQFPDTTTFASTRQEAIERARYALTLDLAEHIDEGDALPPQEHVAEVASLCVELDQNAIDASKCLTMEQAAEELKVSQSRISQLASAGKLDTVVFGKRKLVTIASVNARKTSRKHASKPKNRASHVQEKATAATAAV